MADLPTNYYDDILSASMNGKKKFRLTYRNGTTEEVTIEDISEYDQYGSKFGAGDINKTNQAVNEKFDSGDVVDPMLATEEGFAADAYQTKLQLESCFQSVSNGKALLASAITDKRVPTDAEATFAEMAENIGKIVLGSGNATAGDVLSGKTFTNDDGVEYTGSMPNIKDIDDAIASQYVENGSSGAGIYARMNFGAHVKLAASGFPELFIPQNQLSQAIGLSADKIIKGNRILGIEGTAILAAKTQSGSFSFSVNPNKTIEYQIKFPNTFGNNLYNLVCTVTDGYYKEYITITIKEKLAGGATVYVKSSNTGSNATGTISWIAST